MPIEFPIPGVDKLPTLREVRKSRCLEVSDIAKSLGVRENTVYRWERGACAPPLHDAMRMALLLKTPVDQINWWPHGLLT